MEVVCHDRSGAYAKALRTGTPDAVQVADRFHLWKNLAEAIEKTAAQHRQALRPPEPDNPQETMDPPPAAEAPDEPGIMNAAPVNPLGQRNKMRHRDIQDFIAQGRSRAAIARTLGLHPHTVRRFANAASVQDLLGRTIKDSKPDPFKPHLHQ